MTSQAQLFDYSSAANPQHDGLISNIPYRSFSPAFFEEPGTLATALDLSDALGTAYPATSPSLLANFVRIAASDPEMWHDIFLTNKTALLQRLKTMIAALDDTASMIENGDSDALMVKLSRAKAARDYFADLQQADRKLP